MLDGEGVQRVHGLRLRDLRLQPDAFGCEFGALLLEAVDLVPGEPRVGAGQQHADHHRDGDERGRDGAPALARSLGVRRGHGPRIVYVLHIEIDVLVRHGAQAAELAFRAALAAAGRRVRLGGAQPALHQGILVEGKTGRSHPEPLLAH